MTLPHNIPKLVSGESVVDTLLLNNLIENIEDINSRIGITEGETTIESPPLELVNGVPKLISTGLRLPVNEPRTGSTPVDISVGTSGGDANVIISQVEEANLNKMATFEDFAKLTITDANGLIPVRINTEASTSLGRAAIQNPDDKLDGLEVKAVARTKNGYFFSVDSSVRTDLWRNVARAIVKRPNQDDVILDVLGINYLGINSIHLKAPDTNPPNLEFVENMTISAHYAVLVRAPMLVRMFGATGLSIGDILYGRNTSANRGIKNLYEVVAPLPSSLYYILPIGRTALGEANDPRADFASINADGTIDTNNLQPIDFYKAEVRVNVGASNIGLYENGQTILLGSRPLVVTEVAGNIVTGTRTKETLSLLSYVTGENYHIALPNTQISPLAISMDLGSVDNLANNPGLINKVRVGDAFANNSHYLKITKINGNVITLTRTFLSNSGSYSRETLINGIILGSTKKILDGLTSRDFESVNLREYLKIGVADEEIPFVKVVDKDIEGGTNLVCDFNDYIETFYTIARYALSAQRVLPTFLTKLIMGESTERIEIIKVISRVNKLDSRSITTFRKINQLGNLRANDFERYVRITRISEVSIDFEEPFLSAMLISSTQNARNLVIRNYGE